MLKSGKVLADGPKESVLTEANLLALFGVNVQLHRLDGYFHLF